jgi:hypothetical protein
LPFPEAPTEGESLPTIDTTPAIVTFPLASQTTGVLVAFFLNVTVTPVGTFMVVKLNTPLGGSSNSVFTVGLNAPSAPVLPLLNANARLGETQTLTKNRRLIARDKLFILHSPKSI